MGIEDRMDQNIRETLDDSAPYPSVSAGNLGLNSLETTARYRIGPLRVAELWFRIGQPTACDLVRYFQIAGSPRGVRAVPFTTLCIDIARPTEQIFSSFSSHTRRKVRRSETRDHLAYEFVPHPDRRLIAEFIMSYREFCRQKGLPISGLRRIDALLKQWKLALSVARTVDGKTLVWHSYLISGNRARLLQSVSLFRNYAGSGDRNMMGRANRWLHWRDMCALREVGVATYDLGGWYGGHNDQEKLRINAFKEGFGGTPTVEFGWVVGISVTGRLVAWLLRLHLSMKGAP